MNQKQIDLCKDCELNFIAKRDTIQEALRYVAELNKADGSNAVMTAAGVLLNTFIAELKKAESYKER